MWREEREREREKKKIEREDRETTEKRQRKDSEKTVTEIRKREGEGKKKERGTRIYRDKPEWTHRASKDICRERFIRILDQRSPSARMPMFMGGGFSYGSSASSAVRACFIFLHEN